MTFNHQHIALHKYPRTAHLEGSRLQAGDDDQHHIPYRHLRGRFIVVEEKLDGANAGLSFSDGAELLLQSRGHYLSGGGREKQFNLFKAWATAHEAALLARLQDRYILYGEFMHKKHSVFYDCLPHLFHEFDIYDRSRAVFLSTEARRQLLGTAPVLAVPVLYAGVAPNRLADLLQLLRHSYAKTQNWRTRFEEVVLREGLDLARAWQMADRSDLMEGLYIKVEQDGQVVERYKWVRSDFVQAILDSGQHHSTQPYIANQLATGVDIFAPELTTTWQDLGLQTLE